MTREGLLEKIKFGEWSDIEFKASRDDASKNALKAVSAFANAKGGCVVFGVTEDRGVFSITGVSDADKIQRDFLTQVRNEVSATLEIEPERHEFDEGLIIVFKVPEARRSEKPVYLNGDFRESYIRRGTSNFKCRDIEVAQFIRNRGNNPYDDELVDVDPEEFFDTEALNWYRERVRDGRTDARRDADDISFLRSKGFLRHGEGQSRLQPTRAAVLIFGKLPYVMDQVPRAIVDLKAYSHAIGQPTSSRYTDREIVEDNLVNSFREILAFFRRHTNRPFSIDPETLQRVDDPPENESFREAAVNLLIHQDYGVTWPPARIRIFEDGIEFKNPGESFASQEYLLDPGEKEVRNGRIATAFRRIGFSEQEGAGLPDIFSNWRRLGYVPPTIENDKGESTFRLWLSKELVVSDEHIHIMEGAGIFHPTHESLVFAYLLSRGEVSILDVMALTGLHKEEAFGITDKLEAQGIVMRRESTPPSFHLAGRFAGLSTDRGSATGAVLGQITEDIESSGVPGFDMNRVGPAEWLTEAQISIVENCDVPQSLAELMQATGAGHRGYFRKRHLAPLIARGLLRMTDPDSPTSPAQKYALTRMGLDFKRRALGSK